MGIREAILLGFIVVSLPICFFRPFYGILVWTILAFLNPQAYTWAYGQHQMALLVAVPTLIGVVCFSRGWVSRLGSVEVLMIGVLWIWFTITSMVSVNTPMFVHHAPDTWMRWEQVSKILLMAAMVTAVIHSFRQLRILLLTIGGCFAVFIVKALPFLILTNGDFRLYGPSGSMIADNNDFGLALNMTLPLYLFLAQTESKRWMRIIMAILTLLTIPAIFFTYSRGALVGLVAMAVMLVLRSPKRVLLIPTICLGIAIALLLAPSKWRARMDPTQGLDESAESRINSWTFSWNLASDYPITGGGFETFSRQMFDRYAPHAVDVHGPHSIYFGLLGEHGFPGLFLYLVLVYCSWRSASRVAKQARLNQDHTALCYANMFRFSIVGFLASGTFLGRAYFDYFFTIVACIAALKRLCAVRWAESATVDAQEDELEAFEAVVAEPAPG